MLSWLRMMRPTGSSPYRTAPPERQATDDGRYAGCANGDLIVVIVVFWAASIVRVVGAVVRRETFGAEASLAALVVTFSPLLLRGALAALVRRVRPTKR